MVKQAEHLAVTPVSLLHVMEIPGLVGEQVQDQRDGMLCDSRGSVVADIADHDALLAAGIESDIIGTGCRDQDQFQIRAVAEQITVQHNLVGNHDLMRTYPLQGLPGAGWPG